MSTASSRPPKVYVVGVGMTRFVKPGRPDSDDYPHMAREAATKALLDANLTYPEVQFAAVGYCYGDSTAGQRALYELGQTGIPIINVNNNCSTGSSALYLAHATVASGSAECALALGFEKMAPGSLASVWNDRSNPLEPHLSVISAKHELDLRRPMAPTIFGLAGMEYLAARGITAETDQRRILAKIGQKNHAHSVRNPYSQFRDEYTLEQVEQSRKVFGPLTMLQCCPTSDGAACVVVASEAFVKRHGLGPQAVEIAGIAMTTDAPGALPGYFEGSTPEPEQVNFGKIAGVDMTKMAAARAMGMAGVAPDQVKVCELHDCFSANELVTVDGLGLVDNAVKYVDSFHQQPHGIVATGVNGNKFVVNPSGGLISKGHPLGATGLAQCAELTWQVRGWCGDRQVPGVDRAVALQHNLGLGGAAVVVVYRKPQMDEVKRADGQGKWQDPRKRFGYNPAVEARGVTEAMVAQVRAKAGQMAVGASMRASL
ncbi:thiolase-like protein [Catenaria anguillulae PL171]|uniref:propanoyl-CoA C-acyltransferase n=1 Tax=Catenaria anguillulae PL171 TaxID=765915 RepID=A0A1Y2HUC3_9FUNG|nr:thiolase-like protein [Catenaria anguillulae PL171]